MALSSAERQARLRTKRKVSGFGRNTDPAQSRLDVWILDRRKHELEIIAKLRGTTIREALESLIEEAASAAKAKGFEAWTDAALPCLKGEE